MNLQYLYSVIMPCYCQAQRLLEEGEELSTVKIQNPKKLIEGYIIEKRYELDEESRIHIECVVHCPDCLAGRRLN